MPSVLFFFFVAEASPSVQFVTASLGNVVTDKKKKKKGLIISPEDARSTTNRHCVCVQHGLCLNVSFLSGEKLKRSIMPFVTVVLFLFKYEYCVLYCRKTK